MNVFTLQEIVKGQYGRKIAYSNVSEITPQNVVSVVGSCIGTFNFNKPIIKYLWNYYKGDQPIRYRKKTVRDDIKNCVVENHAYEIVQFKVGQTYGEPVQYISRKDDDDINTAVDKLNDYMMDADKQSKDVKSGEWQSAVGTAFKAVQIVKNPDLPFRIVVPSPLDTFVIYNSYTEEPLLAVQELKDEENNIYRQCYSKNMQFVIKDSKLVSYSLHAYGDIPIVEYPNNWERVSDIELVIDLLDAINNFQSNRVDAVEQFVQSWVKFVNCQIDEEQFKQMKKMGALVVKSNNGENKADVDILTQELNQSESQIAKQDMFDNILAISGIPKLDGNTGNGGDTQGAVELRNNWTGARLRKRIKDPIIKVSEKKLAKIVLNILRINRKGLNLDSMDFETFISNSPQDNMSVKAMTLGYLLQNGIHPKVAINRIGLFEDADKVYLQSRPYLDHLWKTVDDEVKEAETEQQTQTYGFGTSQTGQAQREATGGMDEPQRNDVNE